MILPSTHRLLGLIVALAALIVSIPHAATAQTCVPVPAGLVSSWPGEGAANDVVGSNHAMPINGLSFGPGKVGQAFHFDGVDDYLVTQTPPTSLSLAGAFAFAFWFQATGSSRHNALNWTSGDGVVVPQLGVNMQIPLPSHTAAHRLLCDVYAPFPTNWVRVVSTSTVDDGLWHYAVIQRDLLGGVSLFIDGFLESSGTLFGDATPSSADLFIGSSTVGTSTWAGALDEIDFYSRALTPTEVQALHAAGSAGKCATSDSDGDGLLDGVETNTGIFVDESDTGTDPNNPDTDYDGLLDGTEVDMAEGSGCPNPLEQDSDGDTLLDGVEVLLLGTSPCTGDTDGDCIGDAADLYPLDSNVPQSQIVQLISDFGQMIDTLDLSLFSGPNNNANKGRRNALANRARNAARDLEASNAQEALDKIASLLDKIDGYPQPKDWMHDGAQEKADLAAFAMTLICLLT